LPIVQNNVTKQVQVSLLTNPGSGTVTNVSVATGAGFSGSVASSTTTPVINIYTTVTGLLKGNGTAVSAAVSGSDYAPATSGSALLYGNGTGGFNNVTIGNGLTFSGGTLSGVTTTGSSLLYGNGSGGFNNATIGSGLSFSGGVLSSTSSSTGTVSSVSVVTANGLAGSVATSTTTPAITLSTTVTGLLKGNGTAISAASSGVDYAPATTGASLLYGNSAGGFSNATLGTGLTFFAGVLSATNTNTGTVTSVSGNGAVNGLTLSGTVTTTGYLTLGGTLSNIANNQLSNSSITINGNAISLGGTVNVGTVSSVSGTGSVNGITLTGSVISSGSLTLGGALSGVNNSQLTNSSITINGSTVSLGGSATITANAPNYLNFGTGLSGSSYNGSAPVTVAIANTGVTAGTYGSSTSIPSLTVNAQGQITSVTSNTLNSPAYQGTWNASTNNPTLTSSVGTNNNYYVVSTAGTTTLNGISLWSVGDWAIFNGITNAWEKINGSSSEAFNSITVTGLTGYMYANGSSAVTASTTIPTTSLSGTITNAQLTNSTISGVALGQNLNSLTIGTGLSGTSYNGSTAVTIANTGVLSVSGTSPVNASTTSGATTVSLASGYGDTQNPYASKTANYVLASPNGTAGVPSFRALVSSDIPALPYGAGSVTSVGLALPASVFNVTGSPVTTTGTLTGTLATQPINTLFAGPASGSAGTPTFRSLVTADIPALPYATYPGAGIPLSTGTAWDTSYATNVANGIAVFDANFNLSTNCLFEGFNGLTASGTTQVLTAASVQNWYVTGTGGQTFQLPNATTLPNGATFTFNNNQSSGAITLNNNSGTSIISGGIPSGGYVTLVLLSNSNAAGTWDYHFGAPSNVSWSTNTLSYPGSITNATWNGNNIALNRGGTNASLTASAGAVTYSGASALALNTPGTSGQPLVSGGTGAPTFTSALTGLTIDNTVIGGTTPSTGTFTTITGQTELLRTVGNNLFARSQTFNTYWTSGGINVTVTDNAVTAPDSTTTAAIMLPTTTVGLHRISNPVTYQIYAGITYTTSIYAKANGYRYLYINNGTAIAATSVFDLQAGTVSTTTGSASITSAGSGWYRCSVTGVAPTSGLLGFYWQINNTYATGDQSFAGDGTSSIYIWGGQLEIGSSATTYVTTTATPIWNIPSLSFAATGASQLGLQSDGSLFVQPAGTGALQAQQTTSSATGGNARGANAVDWQTARGVAGSVASGSQSVVSGGYGNSATSGNAFVGAGVSNNATGAQSVIVGGNGNIASNQWTAIVGGYSNTAAGQFNFIGAGSTNSGTASAAVTTQTTTIAVSAGTTIYLSSTNANIKVGQSITGTGINAYQTYATSTVTTGTAAVMNTSTISGTTLTVGSLASGTIIAGMVLTGTGVTAGTYIVSGSASTWTVSVSQTVASTTITGTAYTFTISQNATTAAGITLSFYTPHGIVVGGGNNQATGSYSFIGGGGDAGTAANRNAASGDWSFVGGGTKNTASGSGATIVGGSNNSASGNSYAFIGSGTSNQALGYGCAILGGNQNTVNNTYAASVGGQLNSASGSSSIVIGGERGTTRSINGYTVIPASLQPITTTAGITQSAILMIARQTTDATPTVLASDPNAASSTNQVILPNNAAYSFRATIIAGVTGGGNTASWILQGAIKRGSGVGTTAIVSNVTSILLAQDSGASTWTVAATADTTNGGLAITVTGQAATTIRWVCKVETTEMTF
jgi:hypothetical protein